VDVLGFRDRLAKAWSNASGKPPTECPRCKAPIETPGASFCPKCGEPLLRCPECMGNWYTDDGGVRICKICGARW